MTKYIVKNCPCLEEHTQNCWDPHIPNEISCKDRTDCSIKQIVDECKKYSYIFSERGILASLILQILQVEDVEK